MSQQIEFTPANVKATMKEVGAVSADLWQVPYEDLYIQPGLNIREYDEDYASLLGVSIFNNGYYRDKPLAGYVACIDGRNRIVVTDGHHRHGGIGIAIKMGAELSKIPVVIKPSGTSMEDLTISMVTTSSNKPLTPYEIGTGCKRLQGFGWNEKKIAARLNFTTTYVTDLLFLHGCPSAVRKLVQDGKVSAGVAIAAVREHGDKALGVLTGAVETAEAKGKKKATAKDMTPTWKSEVKKAGPALFGALVFAQGDAAFNKLSEATRTMINDLISNLPAEPTK